MTIVAAPDPHGTCRRSAPPARPLELSSLPAKDDAVVSLSSRPPPSYTTSWDSTSFVSAFAGRNAPPLQSPFPGPNVIEAPLPRACRCHSPRLAISLPSGTHPFEKCSLLTSCRGAIHPCSSYEFTTLAALSRNSNSCTPPLLRGRSPFWGGPHRGAHVCGVL